MVRDQSPLHNNRTHDHIESIESIMGASAFAIISKNSTVCVYAWRGAYMDYKKNPSNFLFAFISLAIYNLVACFSRFSPLTAVSPEPSMCVCAESLTPCTIRTSESFLSSFMLVADIQFELSFITQN